MSERTAATLILVVIGGVLAASLGAWIQRLVGG